MGCSLSVNSSPTRSAIGTGHAAFQFFLPTKQVGSSIMCNLCCLQKRPAAARRGQLLCIILLLRGFCDANHAKGGTEGARRVCGIPMYGVCEKPGASLVCCTQAPQHTRRSQSTPPARMQPSLQSTTCSLVTRSSQCTRNHLDLCCTCYIPFRPLSGFSRSVFRRTIGLGPAPVNR